MVAKNKKTKVVPTIILWRAKNSEAFLICKFPYHPLSLHQSMAALLSPGVVLLVLPNQRYPWGLFLDEFQHRLACDFGDVNGAGGIDCHPVRSVQALNPVQHLAVFRADG